ncbi:actin-like ATPase domain-containing protein [Lentithecium fluviatile CBS 122367]|uniref:Actin-like ATPase domain-containing protein n=1 Tax=Lentithecium fluviatile CBS 122367 TaxID=1168545 RepID=A0A6G1IWN2_9PLEO|nr:actin-like ATPase domain-containing protein [Lentithecium fluviatile CBS 122367]
MFATTLASRPKAVEDHDDDDILVIGIDFGTTFSGAAWATVEDFASDQINLITSWPGIGREEGKVPTELFYEDNQIMWGYEIPADADPVRWFKLLLLKEEDLDPEMRSNEFILRGRKMLKENGKTAVDLIADYLRAIWKHIIETINKSRGESVVDALAFHIVITVPAIWKGYARQEMEEAANKAGLLNRRAAGDTTMTFAPEPESAGLSTLCEPGRKVKVGEVYMICDAGGGTVDLISYNIGDIDPISMDEAVEGTGGLCGGIFIDEAFERMCKARLGRKWDRLSKAGIKEIMKGEWEHAIKPQFKPGNNQKEYIVGIPAEAFGRESLDDTKRQPFIKNGRIHFSSSHIQGAFTEAFAGIDALVNEQIRKANKQGLKVAGIILVGGLGASPYLYEHLKKKHASAGIGILQSGGMRPRTAICRGAVIKGFIDGLSAGGVISQDSLAAINIEAPIKVTSTVSRFSLGMSYRSPFDVSQHLTEDREWDSDEEVWKAGNQMQWFLKRGENSSKKDPIRHSFYRTYRKDPGPRFQATLFQCEDEVPPSRATASVSQLCDISCMIDVPWNKFKTIKKSNGEKIRKLSFEVEMVPSGASVEFAIYIDGRRQGEQNVNVVFQ